MAKIGENNVISGNAIVLWDGITNPEKKTKDDGTVQIVHSLKVAMLPSDPTFNEIDAIAKAALLAHPKLNGVIPPGGYNWHMANDPTKFDGKLTGYIEFNCKTFKGFPPDVFDANNQLLDPMQYGRMLYPGAIVQVLVHSYAYFDKSKGVTLGLDGIRIMDATTTRLNVGAGGIDAAAAFGGAATPVAPAAVAVAPPTAATVTPAPSFLAPPVAAPPVAAPAHQMTATAPGPYEACITAGWTDALLIQHGHMLP